MLPLLVTGLFAVAFALRILPHCFAPAGAGVDHWFWKTYIETYRRERVFPPTLHSTSSTSTSGTRRSSPF